MDERPIRPAAQATLWAFAGRDPRTGAEVGEPHDEIDAFLQTQALQDVLLGVTEEQLHEMEPDAVIALLRSAEEEESDGEEAQPSDHLSATELERLPARTATANSDSTTECAVCLVAFGAGQEVVHLPCSHVFHRACIIRWLARSRRCPFCRAELSQIRAEGAAGWAGDNKPPLSVEAARGDEG